MDGGGWGGEAKDSVRSAAEQFTHRYTAQVRFGGNEAKKQHRGDPRMSERAKCQHVPGPGGSR